MSGNKALLLLVGIAVNFPLVLFRIGEVVVLLVFAHLLVDLFLSKGVKVNVGDAVRDLLDLRVCEFFERV